MRPALKRVLAQAYVLASVAGLDARVRARVLADLHWVASQYGVMLDATACSVLIPASLGERRTRLRTLLHRAIELSDLWGYELERLLILLERSEPRNPPDGWAHARPHLTLVQPEQDDPGIYPAEGR